MLEVEFVTRKECEKYRDRFNCKNEEKDRERSKLWGTVREVQSDIKNLIRQQTWFMGIISSVLAGLIIWLITNK